MKKILLPAALLLALAPAAAAQDAPESTLPPEVKVWIDKIDKLTEKPAEYDMALTMDMAAQGQQIKMKSTGHVLMLDADHMKVSMKINMEMAQMPPMEMSLLTVSDGKTIWIETENPMMGKQIMKAGIKQMAQLQESGMGMGPVGGMNQLSQVKDLFENYYQNFTVTQSEDRVEISGDVSEDIADQQQFAELGLKRFRMVLDAKSGFPIETAMSNGEKDLFVIRMSNLKFLKKEEIKPETFAYTPPEGANVMDIGAMLGGGMADVETDS